jgi:hypothetical protein
VRHTPQQLRKLARHCRALATHSASERQQLLIMANDFETEAIAQEKQHTPIGSGRC